MKRINITEPKFRTTHHQGTTILLMVSNIHCKGLRENIESISHTSQMINELHFIAPIVHKALIKERSGFGVPKHDIPIDKIITHLRLLESVLKTV